MFATRSKCLPALSRLRGAGLLIACWATCFTACTPLKLAAVNLPASFGNYELQRDIHYGAHERQVLDLYVPDRAPEPRAIVMFVHGGGWVAGSKNEYRFVAEALTSRGFIAVLPNYRLHPEVRFPAFIDDVARALLWTRAHAEEFGGDAAKIFLMGHSAGAQIGALIAFNEQHLQRVGGQRAWIKGFIGIAGPYDFLPFRDKYLHDVFGPESQYPASQAINYVTGHAVPTLLLHGEADRVVSASNSRSLATRIRKHGDGVVERYYPDMTHGDVIAAFSIYFRGNRPLLDEVDAFIRGQPALALSR